MLGKDLDYHYMFDKKPIHSRSTDSTLLQKKTYD